MPFEKLTDDLDRLEYRNKKCNFNSCRNPPIRSHTLSRNNLYKLNPELAKVLTFQPKLTPTIKPNPKLIQRVNQNKFTTFLGFCPKHDYDLFRLIDEFDGQVNLKIAVLVHYRNICYGINHIKTQSLKINYMIQQNYTNDESSNLDNAGEEVE